MDCLASAVTEARGEGSSFTTPLKQGRVNLLIFVEENSYNKLVIVTGDTQVDSESIGRFRRKLGWLLAEVYSERSIGQLR